MITAVEKKYIQSHAYIPEHLVGLMTHVLDGEALLIRDCLCCRNAERFIVVGYPLADRFYLQDLEKLITLVSRRFKPRCLSVMAPQLPDAFMAAAVEGQNDTFYVLDPDDAPIRGVLMRRVKKAAQYLELECTGRLGPAHEALSAQFVKRVQPGARVENLLSRMPVYVDAVDDALCLNAWDKKGRLAAFYIVDFSAGAFSAYIIGCHSKEHYVPNATDLLCHELMRISRVYCKASVHLGLGVNPGIRRFKEKWGATAGRPYQMGEQVFSRLSFFQDIMRIKQWK